MPIYRRPRSPYWWTRFTVGGIKIRRSTETADRTQAQEFEATLRAAIWRQRKLGERPDYTWKQAGARWLAETHKRSKWRDENIIEWFDTWLSGEALSAINREIIEKLRTLKARETSESTANRHMAVLRAILRKAAREWDWLHKAPVVPMYPIEPQEPRYLTRVQFAKLRAELPPHLRALAEFSVHTGLRMRNATHLTWDRVDLKRGIVWIPGRSAKGGQAIAVWLNSVAVKVLRAQRGKHRERVFTFEGEPIDDANGAAFVKAKKRAGLDWLRWHDLRHTWASWHVQGGTPLDALRELGGWRSDAMVRRYAHQSPEHLKAYAGHTLRTPKQPKRAKHR